MRLSSRSERLGLVSRPPLRGLASGLAAALRSLYRRSSSCAFSLSRSASSCRLCLTLIVCSFRRSLSAAATSLRVAHAHSGRYEGERMGAWWEEGGWGGVGC